MKLKILNVMLYSNPDNVWVTEAKIIEDIPYFLKNDIIIPKMCEELVNDGILQADIVKVVIYDDGSMYNRRFKMYKIKEEYIEKLGDCKW